MNRRVRDFQRLATPFSPEYSSSRNWKKHGLFFADNRDLLKLTGDVFPGRTPEKDSMEGRHPAFILEKIGNIGFRFCPGTSKPHLQRSVIRRGARTFPDGFRISKDTYILHEYAFNVSDEDDFDNDLAFVGVVSDGDIVGGYHRRRPI